MSPEWPSGVTPPVHPARIDAVALGASAGAVEALSLLLPALPEHFHPAILLVVHRPRHPEHHLARLLASQCALPVCEPQDKEPVRPGTLYLAPPDYHLLVDEGPTLALSVAPPVCFSRPSIDVLLESAAEVYGPHLAAFILTGANADGARGLEAVRRAGGLTGVEAPTTAQYRVMPEAALARGPVDFVLPLEQMVSLLRALGRPGAI